MGQAGKCLGIRGQTPQPSNTQPLMVLTGLLFEAPSSLPWAGDNPRACSLQALRAPQESKAPALLSENQLCNMPFTGCLPFPVSLSFTSATTGSEVLSRDLLLR